jgi:hypothetical protein
MNDNVIKLRQRDEDFPLTFTAFADINPEPRKEWLVKDFLGAAEMSCKFGMPGSAKSVLAGDLAAHVAAGLPWFGRQALSGSVLYLAFERPAEKIIFFAEKWAKQTGYDPRLIIFDTVSRALFGGDENSPCDMGRLVTHVQLIQDRTGAHVQALHHVPMGVPTRMRGHGCLLGACDTTISLERLDDSIRTATTDKNNDGPTGERLAFFLKSVELYRDPGNDCSCRHPSRGQYPAKEAARR